LPLHTHVSPHTLLPHSPESPGCSHRRWPPHYPGSELWVCNVPHLPSAGDMVGTAHVSVPRTLQPALPFPPPHRGRLNSRCSWPTRCRSQRSPTAPPGRPMTPGGGKQRVEMLQPQPTPCPTSPPCPDQGCQTTSTQQQWGCKPQPTPAPCLGCHKGRGHPGVQGTPAEDERAGGAARHCLASLHRGKSWCGGLATSPPGGPAGGQGELTFLMMFAISLSRNSWVSLALSSAAFVCAWDERCSQQRYGGTGVPTSPPPCLAAIPGAQHL